MSCLYYLVWLQCCRWLLMFSWCYVWNWKPVRKCWQPKVHWDGTSLSVEPSKKGIYKERHARIGKKKTGGFLSRYVSAVLKHMGKRIVPPATVFIIFILQLTGALLRLLSSHQLDIINFQTKWTPPCILCNSFDCFHTFWVFTVVGLWNSFESNTARHIFVFKKTYTCQGNDKLRNPLV